MRVQLNWSDERMLARITDIAAGRLAPAVPRDAATVMVLRPAPDDSAPAAPSALVRPESQP